MGGNGDSQRNENTSGSRCSQVNSNRTWERKGSETKLTVGDSEEVIKGYKWCWSAGYVQDMYLGSKNEQIFGVEFKNVNGALVETFAALRAEIVGAVSTELNKGRKWEIVNAGRLRVVDEREAKTIEEKRVVGQMREVIGSSSWRAGSGLMSLGTGTLNSTDVTSKVTDFKSEVDSYKLEFGKQQWNGTNYTVKAGSYRVEAMIFHVKASGSASVKGSNITAQAKGGGKVICAGGKVKINNHLVVG
jgi:hypothetical protein